MYRPPILSLIQSGQIGGVSEAFETTTTNLQTGLNQLRAESQLANIAYFGAGRFVNSGDDTTTGIIRDGGGLSVEVPAVIGTSKIVWMVNGAAFTLDELAGYDVGEHGGMIQIDVPASGTYYGYLQLNFDAEDGYSLSATWTSSADATKRKSGRPCIGKVTTDADSITAIDATVADVIFSMAYLQARLAALATGGGNGGGDGSGGPQFATQLPISEEDATDTKEYVDSRFADIETALGKLEDANQLFPAPFDILADEIAINRIGVGESNPHAIERGQISVIGDGFGHGQDDTPDYSPDTGDPLELPWDAMTSTFGS